MFMQHNTFSIFTADMAQLDILLVIRITLLSFISLGKYTNAQRDEDLIIYWSDQRTGSELCPGTRAPLDDTPEKHKAILAVIQKRNWTDAWLSLTKDPASGKWKWLDAHDLEPAASHWATNEPVISSSATCTTIGRDGLWRTQDCDSRHYGYCLREDADGKGSNSSPKTVIVILAVCGVVAAIIVVLSIFYLFRRFRRVRRAAGHSGVYGETSEPIGQPKTYKRLSQNAANDLLSNEEI